MRYAPAEQETLAELPDHKDHRPGADHAEVAGVALSPARMPGPGVGGMLALQRMAGNRAVGRLLVQRQESSFPEGAEEQLQAMAGGGGGGGAGGEYDEQTVQTHVQRVPVARAGADLTAGNRGRQLTVSRSVKGAIPVQRRGGATVGQLCIRSNVVGGGLTDGHAWLSYTPTGGSETTYGTWGNRTPIGLHRDLEVGRAFAASRCFDVDAADVTALNSFASANNDWGYLNNCSSFAARGWAAVTGESLSYTTWGIPNPSALGTGITAANGGSPSGTLVPAPAGAGGGSSSL